MASIPVWIPYLLGAITCLVSILILLVCMRPTWDKYKDIFRKIETLLRKYYAIMITGVQQEVLKLVLVEQDKIIIIMLVLT